MTPDELLSIGDSIVARARPGEALEVVVVHSRDTEVRVYDGEVEQFTSAASAGVGVRVVADHRQGFAYAGTFDPAALADALDDARDNATFGTVDPHLGLATPDGVAVAPLDLFDERLVSMATDDKIALALELERLVLAGDPRISGVESIDYSDQEASAAVVSTAGIRTVSSETGCALTAYILASDGDETTEGFGFSVGRHAGELDLERCAADAVERAVRMLGARPAASERLTVILDPWVTAQLLGIVGDIFSAEAVLKGRSLFAGRLGEPVAAPSITLIDDATDARSFTASQTDGEGLATRPTRLIDGGVASGFLYDTYTARALGAASTGSALRYGYKSTPTAGAQSLSLVPGHLDPVALRAQVGDGVLIQEVSGLHSGVNPVSGDFSTGAEGVRIRGGELAEPIREITIASTLQRMLSDVVGVGSDLEFFPMEASGVSLAIADVTVSGGGA